MHIEDTLTAPDIGHLFLAAYHVCPVIGWKGICGDSISGIPMLDWNAYNCVLYWVPPLEILTTSNAQNASPGVQTALLAASTPALLRAPDRVHILSRSLIHSRNALIFFRIPNCNLRPTEIRSCPPAQFARPIDSFSQCIMIAKKRPLLQRGTWRVTQA
jgi:hypothetical protein